MIQTERASQMKKLILTVSVFLSLSGVSLSSSAVTVMGGVSCGNWVAARIQNTATASGYSLWMLGYLSGRAVSTNIDILKKPDYQSIDLWLDNYCRATPLMTLADAGDALFFELAKNTR